jgi:hypothetical protein
MNTHARFPAILVTLACTLLAPAGCEDKAGGGSDPAKTGDKSGTGSSAAPTKTAAAAALAFKNLDKLGAKIEVPADAEITDASADAPAVSIFTPAGDLSIDVVVTTEVYASSIDAAKEEIKKDPNPFKKFTVENKTADGWHLEFELESMMDKTPLYGVQIRKKIGDKSIQCSRNVKTEAERAKVSKACASLTKA